MGLKSRISKRINSTQIKALLWKDLLMRIRQPWLTALQYIWPILIFSAVYLLRYRFNAFYEDDCQFPTRELPSPGTLLPFFQSYICSIENECSSIDNYTEISDFPNAPVTPVLNIVQTFLNEDKLYNAVVDLPQTANFLGSITAVASHAKFKVLEENVGRLMAMVSSNGSPIGGDFDINNLFSDDRTFSNSGKIFCGKPFPRSNQIRFIERVFYSEDFNGANKEEVDAMPTPYCKQLYLDVTGTNNGKITWNYIKPIIGGKIIYGPVNEQTNKIIVNANDTMQTMFRLRTFLKGVDTVIKKLRAEGDFHDKFMNIVKLAETPLVRGLLASFGIDKKVLDTLFDGLLYDKQVADIVETIGNIFDCFSVDRFVGVDSEQEMEDLAIELNEKKLFYAGVYFDEDGARDHQYSYKIRMDADNTPGTVDNRERFWYPGPRKNFELQHRYHRGFVQIQHVVDQAIIKTNVDEKNAALEEEWTTTSTTEATAQSTSPDDEDEDDDDDFDFQPSVTNPADNDDEVLEFSSSTDHSATLVIAGLAEANAGNETESEDQDSAPNVDPSTVLTEDDEDDGASGAADVPKIRRKRQFDFFGDLLGGGSTSAKSSFAGIEYGNLQTFTKQFPYPRYFSDDYQIGVYMAQIIQLLYFFALIGQVANAVRNRIWMRESGNSRLMRIMGLQYASENVSWIITTFIELALTFFITEFILYMGGTLHTTNRFLLYLFLLYFGVCIISFCYMMSNLFESASIGSVSTVIVFLMTYMPYIILVALSTIVSSGSKIFASFSFATSFCYAWRYIMLLEIQQRPLTFSNAFAGTLYTNDLKLAVVMLTLDIILYAVLGYCFEQWRTDDTQFHEIEKKDMDLSVGGALQNCTKMYEGSEQAAVDGVSIVFRRNVVTCLLGRNGAGKSTIIKLLTGQIEPTGGKVFWPQNWDRITGHEYDECVGVCPQNNILMPNLTAREHLEMYVRIKTKSAGGDKEVDRVMAYLHFGKYENYYSQHLSGGFRRRLNVAIAFIASPNLVILDEPCSGVDVRARKNIWDLVSSLRQGRSVVLATHHLDEAEHLSDNILILKEGKVIAEYNSDILKNHFTQAFELHVHFESMNNGDAIASIERLLKELAPPHYSIKNTPGGTFVANIPYKSNESDDLWRHSPMIHALEQLVRTKTIQSFRIVNSNLDRMFNDLVRPANDPMANGDALTAFDAEKKNNENGALSVIQREKLTELEIMKILLRKRFLHFKRNYRLIVCVLVLPVLFEMIAMGLMIQRPPGEHGKNLQFSRGLYPGSQEVYSHENDIDIQRDIFHEYTTHFHYDQHDEFGNTCKVFNSSEGLYRYVVNTTHDYPDSRYGGISSNGTRSLIWYNNAGFHAMPVFLNQFSAAYLRTLMNSSSFDIKTRNHPLIMADHQISTSSILQQLGDAAVSLIILIAFSLVAAGASNYIVNERVSGEKLQQRLSDVSFKTYWGVNFMWDFTVYIIALLLAAIVFRIFNLPVFNDKDNLYGVLLLLLLFGFSSTHMVHLCEKLFSEASIANMYLLCLNIMLGLCTSMTIILFDVLGESEMSDQIRHFLNRVFLILPQHALADGLIEICKNDIVAKLFARYYIDSYKSPISTKLVVPHYISLICTGIIFWLINYVIESGIWRSYIKKTNNMASENIDLETIATVHQNGTILADDLKKRDNSTEFSMKVDKLTKCYGNHEAVKDVSFNVKLGECFGLLGANGAGKSTIFAMLSGELAPTSGTINISNRANGIAYCPQTNPLDNLLTVQEVMYFYGQLRRIKNIHEVSERSMHRFHLTPYRHVLVQNLSGGNRRKLSVAVTCFGLSSTVLMDEPTSDMDPVTRSIVYAAINSLLLERRSVILTSHTITEIDRVCDRIGIMRLGKMIAIAPPKQLKSMYGNRYSITVYYDEIEALTIERDIRKAIPCVEDLTVYNHCLQFRSKIQTINQQSVANGNPYNNSSSNINNNNELVSEAVIDDGMIFSELVDKLHMLSVDRGITFTITECLLDQAFERVLDTNRTNHSYQNTAYTSTEATS